MSKKQKKLEKRKQTPEIADTPEFISYFCSNIRFGNISYTSEETEGIIKLGLQKKVLQECWKQYGDFPFYSFLSRLKADYLVSFIEAGREFPAFMELLRRNIQNFYKYKKLIPYLNEFITEEKVYDLVYRVLSTGYFLEQYDIISVYMILNLQDKQFVYDQILTVLTKTKFNLDKLKKLIKNIDFTEEQKDKLEGKLLMFLLSKE